MQIQIPELSLVLIIGASGSGKSSFARKWFKPTEIVSSDECRAIVSNDENNMDATSDAFDLLYYTVGKRLKRGLATVVDATNVRTEDRKQLVALAREYHVLPTAIILNMPVGVCIDRNRERTDRSMPPHIVVNHISQLKKGIARIKYEGFRRIHEFRKPEEVDAITAIVREPLWNNRKSETGPFDIIGDVHGCYDELCTLLGYLGCQVDKDRHRVITTNGRKLVFVGDLVDRGPASPSVMKLVMQAVADDMALCVPGNHDMKLLRYLNGKDVQLRHGLEQTVIQLATEDTTFREKLKVFLEGLISHYVLDGGRLVVAHAGLKEEMQGRGSGAVREFCLYGETTGEIDEFGLPVRYNWAAAYKGSAMVVYGHTPVPQAEWFNNTIDIDTGCVFGGKLTALRYPEKELVSVPASRVYAASIRPLTPAVSTSLQQEHDDMLDIAEVLTKQVIETRLAGNITIPKANASTALEVMSRFGVNPKWLIYLPPTMSPSETSTLPEFLEHPAEAFAHFKAQGIKQVVCEEKHMGSRAVVIVCKDTDVVKHRFGILERERIGICYTRTGRRFFADMELEQAFLQSIQQSLSQTGFWERFDTDWVCLDGELMPWSAKAQTLLQNQYAATGTAAIHAIREVVDTMSSVADHPDMQSLIGSYTERLQSAEHFRDAYRKYCWPVNSLDDYKFAPFHILATEGRNWTDKDHKWHLGEIDAAIPDGDRLLMKTDAISVDLDDELQIQAATDWWIKMTAGGGEGMVVKPLQYIVKGSKGLVQPAIKIRGREYLRIIYGPEYTTQQNMERLKQRGLRTKRTLALKEFALGVEALERFVKHEPLRRVHQCVFGVLALESEPVDPRL
ncbi:MAG: polynucleotide kinase-phosphatase [Sphingobacteriales bacterium]|nr:MAG: polynucleotide kinase-phosphatase [Sphingobacteriales bacterium]